MSLSFLVNPPPKRTKIVGRMVLCLDEQERRNVAKAKPRSIEDDRAEDRKRRCREWYAKNKDYWKARVKARALAKRDEIRAKKREQYQAKREQASIRARLYYLANRERILARVNARYAAKKAAK